MSRVDVAVIVVGFNAVDYVRQCLSSLRSATWGTYTFRTVYVDNASIDGSAEMVRREFPGVDVVANRENVGFCRACNQAAAVTASRYVYFLNNDTVVFPDTIPALVRFLDARPEVGVAGNRLLNPDRSDQWSARRFPSALNALFGRRTWLGRRFANGGAMRDYLYKDQMRRGEPFQVDWVPGSCSLVRREAYECVGGLPGDMHYWSDAVFCDRIAAAGWQTFVVPAAVLVHFEGQGTGVHSFDVRRWLIADFHRGAYRFYCEHYRLTRMHPARWAAWLGLDLRRRLLVAAARKEFERS